MFREPFSFFVKIEKISNADTFFPTLETYSLKYSYFQIDSNYYLFLFGKTHLTEILDFCYQSLLILEELNTKQRKLRSLRGFILYVLEIIEKDQDKNMTVLKTNLPPFFWVRVKEVIRQNQKGLLNKFLFGTSNLSMEDLLQNLQTEVIGLKNRLTSLEEEFKINQNS
jgi:hypothetical protein